MYEREISRSLDRIAKVLEAMERRSRREEQRTPMDREWRSEMTTYGERVAVRVEYLDPGDTDWTVYEIWTYDLSGLLDSKAGAGDGEREET